MTLTFDSQTAELVDILPLLTSLAGNEVLNADDAETDSSAVCQQMALLNIKLLAKLLAAQDLKPFEEV